MIKRIALQLVIFFFIIFSNSVEGQKVGVVLSGGGSSGLAHIGVLKALEDLEIPIDYITGTSMGAVIGGLYAAGLSPEEIESFFLSKKFRSSLQGEIEEEYKYFYKKDEDDASWIKIKTNSDSLLLNLIPTNALSPVQLDIELLETVAGACAVSNYSFDSLFIPFRCVASDVENKQQVIFDSGELHTALRASSTYPFFFRPIYVDGELLFDGGLYNNFPSDILYNAFSPDIIIGSNVSSNAKSPDADDLFSQLENMISSPTDFNLPCDDGIIISPITNTFTLDFSNPEGNINTGYESTMEVRDSLFSLVEKRISKHEVEIKREIFNDKIPLFLIDSVKLEANKKFEINYYEKLFSRSNKRGSFTIADIKKRYFRLFEDDKIAYIYPSLRYDKKKGYYNMKVNLTKEKDFAFDFGGNISSRPVNMGFVGAKYNMFGKVPKNVHAKAYFGKFYNSLKLSSRLDFYYKRPLFIQAEGTIQQWDYFKNFVSFFEESKPPFILQRDNFASLSLGTPANNRGKIVADFRIGNNKNEYYQVDDFLPTDTTDQTTLDFISVGLQWERNSLNAKQYANDGTYLLLSARYIEATETTTPGSTGIIDEMVEKDHNWITFKLEYENYFKKIGDLRIGYNLNGVFSTTPLLSNYKATILSSPGFQPIPESQTIFQDEFRAHKYGAAGLKFIYEPFNRVDFRLSGFMYQPVNQIFQNDLNQAIYGAEFNNRYYIVSSAAVFHSPLGPLSFSVNYYDKREENFSYIVNFGYLIFNDKPLF